MSVSRIQLPLRKQTFVASGHLYRISHVQLEESCSDSLISEVRSEEGWRGFGSSFSPNLLLRSSGASGHSVV